MGAVSMTNGRSPAALLLKTGGIGCAAGAMLGGFFGMLYGPIVALLLWWSNEVPARSIFADIVVDLVFGFLIGSGIGGVLGLPRGVVNALVILRASPTNARVIGAIASFAGVLLISWWCRFVPVDAGPGPWFLNVVLPAIIAGAGAWVVVPRVNNSGTRI